MLSISSTKIPKADRKLFKLLEEYYFLLQSAELKELASKYYHYSTKDEEISKLILVNRKKLQILERLFKGIIVERNNFAARKGHDNFIDYVIHRDGIPQKKAYEMLNNADKILKKANLISGEMESRGSDPLYFIQRRQFELVKEGMSLVERYDREFFDLLPSVVIENSHHFSTEHIDDKVLVKATLKSKNLYAFSNLVHELGHAKQILTTTHKEYVQLSRFEREKFAYTYQLTMLSKYIEPYELDVIKWKLVGKIADAWFEYKIHTEEVNINKTFIESRNFLYANKYRDNPIDYLLNINYQKHAGESIMRGLIANDLIK